MPDSDLQSRLEMLRTDFQVVRGQSFKHFFCPILHNDEPGPLCMGHIVPAAFGTSNATVPQRADIDNFYGFATEADFIAAVQDRNKNPAEIWATPRLNRQHRPRIECDGLPLDHFMPRKVAGPVEGQTPVKVVTDDDEHICDVVLKMSSEDAQKLVGKKIDLVIDRDYRAAVIASLLKSAHLTLFSMLGYQYVFSPAGIYLAEILRTFFLKYRDTPKKEFTGAISSYFTQFERMAAPIESDAVFEGTIKDNIVLGCYGASGGVFAIAVVVKAGDDTLCVFIPNDNSKAVETYFGFLNEPPQSVVANVVHFVPANSERGSYWESPKSDPFRIHLKRTLEDQ